MVNLCFAIWCLGADARPDHIRVMTTQDVYQNAGVDNRLIAAEGHWPGSRSMAARLSPPAKCRGMARS